MGLLVEIIISRKARGARKGRICNHSHLKPGSQPHQEFRALSFFAGECDIGLMKLKDLFYQC